jgi:hypothetical protein
VSGIWGQLPYGFGQLPPEVNGKLRRSQDPKSIKKPAFYAGLVEVLGSLRILSDLSNGGPGTNQKSPEAIDSNMVSEIEA